MMKTIRIAGMILSILCATTSLHAQTPPATFECTMSDAIIGDNAVGEKIVFKKNTPIFYYVCKSRDVVKGQTVTAKWISIDSNGVAPPNYLIDEASLAVADTMTGNLVWTGKYSLSKPYKGWPLGTYRVDLYVNTTKVTSQNFSVK